MTTTFCVIELNKCLVAFLWMSSLVCSLPASLMAGDNPCKTKLSVWVSSDGQWHCKRWWGCRVRLTGLTHRYACTNAYTHTHARTHTHIKYIINININASACDIMRFIIPVNTKKSQSVRNAVTKRWTFTINNIAETSLCLGSIKTVHLYCTFYSYETASVHNQLIIIIIN